MTTRKFRIVPDRNFTYRVDEWSTVNELWYLCAYDDINSLPFSFPHKDAAKEWIKEKIKKDEERDIHLAQPIEYYP